jgi:hypothetical protein
VTKRGDKSVTQKGEGKELKYKSLCLEIKGMWSVKCMIIRAIAGATGIATKVVKKAVEAMPGKLSVFSLQKTAVLGTSHVIRKVLQSGTLSLSFGDRHWFKRKIVREKGPVTRDIILLIIIIIIIIIMWITMQGRRGVV